MDDLARAGNGTMLPYVTLAERNVCAEESIYEVPLKENVWSHSRQSRLVRVY